MTLYAQYVEDPDQYYTVTIVLMAWACFPAKFPCF